MAHTLSPEQIAQLREDVLAAEQGAFEAKRKAEVDRIKHSAQLHELNEQIATAKTINTNTPGNSSLTKARPQPLPTEPGPSNTRMLLSEKHALDRNLREQQTSAKVLQRELSQLQDQFSEIEAVYAPVGPYQYAPCDIVSVNKNQIVLIRQDTRECLECALDQIMPKDPTTVSLPHNLMDLEYLNLPSLLQALNSMWDTGKEQVLCGPNIAVMCDPNTRSTPEMVQQPTELSKLVQRITAAAFDDRMMRGLVCSGLSGSGKSATACKVVQSLLHAHEGHAEAAPEVFDIWENSCAVLDAFGKAGETSRCGTFYEVQLGESVGKVVGGLESCVVGVAITCFGLESNQVVAQRTNQPNFNAFYTLCNAHACGDLSHLRLRAPATFRYLASKTVEHSSGSHGGDASELSKLESSLSLIGIESKEVSQVWSIMASILHLGDLTFTHGANDTVLVEPLTTVRTIASLLSVSAIELASTLSGLGKDPNRKSMGSRHRPEAAAAQGRDALARILYDRLFNFLVQRVNDASCADSSVALLGVLDPPGALQTDEHSPGNFQTLMRNFVHERMLHLFSTHMFTQQQMRMKAEGVVPLTDLEAPDVIGRLEMLEKRGGLFSIVDEVQALPQAQPMALFTKLVSNLSGHPDFIATGAPVTSPGQAQPRHSLGFTLKHSFGESFYNIRDFLDTDGDDSFSASLRGLQGTASSLLLQLFPALLTGDPFKYVSALRMTKSAMIRAQLASLKQMLNPAILTFIHCIAVNEPSDSEGSTFNMRLVQRQLEALCVLPSVLWQRFGYPISMSIETFWDKYYMLCPFRKESQDSPWPNNNMKTAVCELLCLQPFEKHHWRIGETQVFLRPGPLNVLQRRRDAALHKSASVISSRLRRDRVFKFMAERKHAMSVLQPVIRGILTRQLYNRALECAFMSFSERESHKHNAQHKAEQAREEQARIMMAAEQEASIDAWDTIQGAEKAENFNLCQMYEEGLRSQALNANWKLKKSLETQAAEEQNHGADATHVSSGNEVYALDDINHETPFSEILDISNLAVAALQDLSKLSIDQVVAKAEEEAKQERHREMIESSNRVQMFGQEEYLRDVYRQLAQRKKLSPNAELAMMVEAEYNQKMQISFANHKKMEAEIDKMAEQAATYEPTEAAEDLFAMCLNLSKEIMESRVGASSDPRKVAAADRLVAAQDTQLMVTDMIDDLIMNAEKQGSKMIKMRKAIEQTELRKRELENLQDQQHFKIEQEREEKLAAEAAQRQRQKAREKAKAAAEKAEEEAKRKKAEQAERDALDLDGDGIPDDLSSSPVVRALQLERRSAQWKKKEESYKAAQDGTRPPAGLTRSQQSIENKLQELQGLLSMTENVSDDQAMKIMNQSLESQEDQHKYMFKYKFKALVVDDDTEML